MSQEDDTPKPDWAELARQAQYVREQNFETLRRLIEAGRVAEAHLGPTLAAGQELMRAMDAGIREVMEAVRGFGGQPPLPTGAALLTGTAALGGKGTLTAAGGLSLNPITFAGEAQVSAGDASGELKRKLPGLSPGLILAVLIVLLVAGDLSLAEMYLPPEAQTVITDAEVNLSLLVPFAFWIWRQNHRDR